MTQPGDARAALAELLAAAEALERCPVCCLDADEHGQHFARWRSAKARAKRELANAPN